MCYAEVEDVTADGVVENCGVERDDMLVVFWIGRFTAEGLCEGEDDRT